MRLLSYNIHKGIGASDRRYRLERIIHVIRHEQPDLVCLQEVTQHARRTRHDDQPRILADHFEPAGHMFQMNVHYRIGGYGNLLLSRWPLLSAHHVSLRLRKRKPRGAQVAVIQTPEGQLNLTNWHLGLREEERHWQVNHFLEHHHFRLGDHLPTLITGDYNDWRNTLAGGPFADHGFHQVTAPPTKFRSFPSFMTVMSLDKAFVRGGIVIDRVHIVRSKLTRRASDHLPLVIDFHLANGAAQGSVSS